MGWTTYVKREEDGVWYVDLTKDKALVSVEFIDEAAADTFIKERVMDIPKGKDAVLYADIPTFDGISGNWEIKVFVGDYPEPTIKSFHSEDEAKEFRSQCKPLKKKQKDKVKDEVEDEITFLDEMSNEMDKSMSMIENADDTPEELAELQEKLKEFKDDYDRKKEEAESKATEVLSKAAEFYLGEKVINENQYAKFKTQIHRMGLTSLLFQLEMAQKNMYKLSEEFHTNQPFARVGEVLTGMQRVILDINKFIFEYVESAEESLRKMRQEIDDIAMNVDGEGGEITEEKLIYYRSSKKLIGDIQSIKSELNEYGENIAKPSANKKLRVEHNEPEPDEATVILDDDIEEEYDENNSGLEGFEGKASEKTKKDDDDDDW